MSIESFVEANSVQSISVNDVLSHSTYKKQTPDKLAAFKHFPNPIFLIDKRMNMLEQNDQGRKAIEHHWIGLAGKKLHFINRKNDKYVGKIIARLGRSNLSEKFALRCFDTVCRSFTISSLSPNSREMILTIQGELNYTRNEIDSISRAFSLTTSETNIVELMVRGLKPKEIAYEVGVSLNTVRSHLRTLYAKMQVRSFNDVLTEAIRLLV